MYYIYVEDGNLTGAGQAPEVSNNVINFPVSYEVFDAYCEDHLKYIWNGEAVVENPNYEEDSAAREKERIGNLQITKRVFALALQQMGISYNQLKQLIATSEQAQLEWDLCVELQRSNPLLDSMAAQLGVSSAMLDYIFQTANGEDVDVPED